NRLSIVFAGLALFAGGAAVLYNALDRVQQRVTVWLPPRAADKGECQHNTVGLEPWTDDKVYCTINGALEYRQNCDSYQLVKSLYSIAKGGLAGPRARQRAS